MTDNGLVTAWKNPAARGRDTAAHPAGSIQLGTGAVVGRRARLLAGMATASEDPTGLPTYSLTFTWTGCAAG